MFIVDEVFNFIAESAQAGIREWEMTNGQIGTVSAFQYEGAAMAIGLELCMRALWGGDTGTGVDFFVDAVSLKYTGYEKDRFGKIGRQPIHEHNYKFNELLRKSRIAMDEAGKKGMYSTLK